MEKNLKNNNFFNLISDEEEEEENEDDEDLKAKTRKWDWDLEENYSKFYTQDFNNKKIKKDECTSYGSTSKQLLSSESNRFRIEKSNESIFKYDLIGHTSSVNRIEWCKKYQNKNILLASSMDNKISIWNIDSLNKPVQVFDKIHSKSIRNAIWSLQETEIITASFDQSSIILNSETGKEINQLKHTSILTAVANHPSDLNLVLIGAKHEVLGWDIRTDKICKSYKYKSPMGQVQELLFLNDNEFISCGDVVSKESAENSIIVWDFKSTSSISNQIFHEKYIATCLKKHPNHSLFLAQTHGNYIAEFSSKSPFKMNKFKRFESNGHKTAGYSIGFDLNMNGSILASGSSNGCVYIYNFSTSKLIQKLEIFTKYFVQPCMDVKFQRFNSDNKCLLAASSLNGMIKIFDL